MKLLILFIIVIGYLIWLAIDWFIRWRNEFDQQSKDMWEGYKRKED